MTVQFLIGVAVIRKAAFVRLGHCYSRLSEVRATPQKIIAQNKAPKGLQTTDCSC